MCNTIPESELHITFARASGPGGQNVNKTSTKAIIHWNVGASSIFDDNQKNRIRSKLVNRLNNEDCIVVASEEERSQVQNRKLAIERLQDLVNKSLHVPKKRKATCPTYSSKLKRLEQKKKHSQKKRIRQAFEE